MTRKAGSILKGSLFRSMTRRSLLGASGAALLGMAAADPLSVTLASRQSEASSNETVCDLLSLVPPDVVPFDNLLFTFADLERQLDALAVPMPEVVDGVLEAREEVRESVGSLPLQSNAYDYGFDEV